MIYAHLNRLIKNQDLNVIYIAGPGHGGPGLVASTYLDGTYSEVYPHISPDATGMARLFRQFSFPGGIPSHVAPETPGSIHEGGELGYAQVHAHGAAFDTPDLIAACVVGDGESETGPLAGSWHSNKFLDPAQDGAVLPILHLNGYKIANPTVPARIPHEELESLLRGYGYTVHTVEGHDPKLVHQQLAATLDTVIGEIRAIWRRAREEGDLTRPAWPVIVFKTPKGWTGPKVVDGLPVEGTWRAHQVPLDAARTNPEHLAQLESWMRSYKAEELFDSNGTLRPEIARLAPHGDRRMSANPHANGGLLLRELNLPDFRDYAVPVPEPGATEAEATRVLGTWLRDVIRGNPSNFRIFGPDETESNRLGAVYEVTNKAFDAVRHGHDERPRPVPPGHGRDRPGARAGRLGWAPASADGGQADHVPGLHPRIRRGRAGDPRLEVAVLTAGRRRDGNRRPGPRARPGRSDDLTAPGLVLQAARKAPRAWKLFFIRQAANL